MHNFHSMEELGISINPKNKKNKPNSFKPIGIGKPLIIRLNSVYLGDIKNGRRNKKRDIIVTSRLKDDITYGVELRGVHQIFEDGVDRDLLATSASNLGTELIYYSQAVEHGRILIDLELKSDRFNTTTLDNIINAINGAGKLPLFSAHSSLLIAGAEILNLGGSIVSNLIKKVPFFKTSFNFNDGIGGFKDTKAGFKYGVRDVDVKNQEFKGYVTTEVDGRENVYQLTKNGVPYNGDSPYIIVSLDGRSNHHYENFKATVASASILKKFFGDKENSNIEDLNKMAEVFNDYTYLTKIEKAKDQKETAKTKKDKGEFDKLIKAYEENVINKKYFNLK